MVALLHPDRDPLARPNPARSTARRPHLTVIEGGAGRPSGAAALASPVVVATVAVVALLSLVVALRVAQGGPPAGSWSEMPALGSGSATGSAGPGSMGAGVVGNHVVTADDTRFSLAETHLPHLDTDEAVRLLVAANGGFDLEIGALVVVPDAAP